MTYRKSAKGAEAIATRQHGLGPKLRPILILVDGKRDFAALASMASAFGDIEQLLTQLLAGGFIEEVPGAQPAQRTPEAPSSTAGVPITLAQAQRLVVRRVTDILGPNAEQLCLRIESARNLQEFEAAVSRAQDLVRGVGGAQVAAEFAAAMLDYRPTA